MSMNKIVVVCTGNTCRSPMAKGIIEAIIEEHNIIGTTVISRGLAANEGDAASENAVLALEEIGIDIKDHRSIPITKEEILEADCVYVMTEHHKNAIIDSLPEVSGKIIVMNISDPFSRSMDIYRECRDEMLRYFTKELLGE